MGKIVTTYNSADNIVAGTESVSASSLREACGVFGVYYGAANTHRDLARTVFYGLVALQHRGQESAGIATCVYPEKDVKLHKGMGLVNRVFKDEDINQLEGTRASHAIGHNRYSTVGDSDACLAQPFACLTKWGPLAVAHNGTLTMTKVLEKKIREHEPNAVFRSDSQMILAYLMHLANRKDKVDWLECIMEFMREVDAAYSLIIMTDDALYAVRDVYGVRPLCIGAMQESSNDPSVTESGASHPGYVISSESCALNTVGATLLREVKPGEVIRIDATGLTSTTFKQDPEHIRPLSMCVFEFVYFSRPDSIWNDKFVHTVRQRCGMELAKECPTEADFVMSIPDSSTAAAIGYSFASRIPYNEGLTKNQHIGRTFIQPDHNSRIAKIKLKYNVLTHNIRGKRLVIIDDSLVRGNTMRAMVTLFREAGAKEIHIRIASPPVRFPCHMGVNISTFDELIAHRAGTVEKVREYIGADSLYYLSHEGMMKSVHGAEDVACSKSKTGGYCSACFTGDYTPHPNPNLEW